MPRRFARIARPARVRIRRRKPWVLARRRLFGWKVRLLTRGLQKKSVVSGCRLGCHRAPTSSSLTPECTASRSLFAICAHRRQAAATIDNSTWLRYARLRHPVKPALPGRHYPQPGDNNLNRMGRPDYRGWTPVRSLLSAPSGSCRPPQLLRSTRPPELQPNPSQESHVRGTRERACPVADVPADLAAVWPRVLEQLLGEGRGQGVETKDEHWIKRCQPLALVADTALLAVPNEFAKGVLEGRTAPIVSETLSRECGRPIRIAITVDDSVGESPAPPAPPTQSQQRYDEPERPSGQGRDGYRGYGRHRADDHMDDHPQGRPDQQQPRGDQLPTARPAYPDYQRPDPGARRGPRRTTTAGSSSGSASRTGTRTRHPPRTTASSRRTALPTTSSGPTTSSSGPGTTSLAPTTTSARTAVTVVPSRRRSPGTGMSTEADPSAPICPPPVAPRARSPRSRRPRPVPESPPRASTRSTSSTRSSSAPRTVSRTPQRSPSPRRPPRRTTPSSSTESRDSARRTCCTRSGTTRAASTRARACGT